MFFFIRLTETRIFFWFFIFETIEVIIFQLIGKIVFIQAACLPLRLMRISSRDTLYITYYIISRKYKYKYVLKVFNIIIAKLKYNRFCKKQMSKYSSFSKSDFFFIFPNYYWTILTLNFPKYKLQFATWRHNSRWKFELF